jgi:hypothetical protein
VLMSALLAGACAGGQRTPAPTESKVSDSPYAKPQPADTGRGCYDHRGRIERTITTAAECAVIDWVWRN